MIKTLKVAGILVGFSMSLTAQNISFNMEVTTPKSKEPMNMRVVSSSDKTVMQLTNMSQQQNSMKILIDNATDKKYILMDNNGEKIATMVNPFEVEKAMESAKEPKITATKETRTIDGYQCTKVIAETDEVTSDLWLTQEAGFTYNELYKIFNSTKGTPGARASLPALKDVKGFPIEIVSKQKSKEGSVTVRIKDISRAKVDPQYFSLDGYKVVNMMKSGQ